jgi:hypothetical protein
MNGAWKSFPLIPKEQMAVLIVLILAKIRRSAQRTGAMDIYNYLFINFSATNTLITKYWP